MRHLGDDVSALVDGQLPPARAEEALAHLVVCERCASLVAVERASRHHLAQAGEVPPSDDLTWRLLQLADTTPSPPAANGARALADRAWHPLTTGRGRRRALVRGTVALVGVAGIVGALVVVGTLAERTGDPAGMLAGAAGRTPQDELRLRASTVQLDRAGGDEGPTTTTEAALAWLPDHGWIAPAELPRWASISHIGTRSSATGVELVEIEVVRDGELVRVLQQPGVLDAEAVVQLGDGHGLVHEIPGPGTTLVLQCEGVVVVVTSHDDELAREVAAAFPATAPQSDVTDRLDRGWQTVVGWTDLLVQAP